MRDTTDSHKGSVVEELAEAAHDAITGGALPYPIFLRLRDALAAYEMLHGKEPMHD